VLGALVASEGWAVVTGSQERVIEQGDEVHMLRGMSSRDARERHLLTMLVMPTLDLYKPYALNTYSGTVLCHLTGRERPYSADEVEHALLSYVRMGWTEPLTADVARWATLLWADDAQSTVPVSGSSVHASS
jgi:hypothetical protein